MILDGLDSVDYSIALRLPTALRHVGLRFTDERKIEDLFGSDLASNSRQAFAPVNHDLLQAFGNGSVARYGFHVLVVNARHEITVFVPREFHYSADSLLAIS